jgi:hypothetical protein
MDRLILDLCGGTGSWSQPYRDAGYRVVIVDPYSDVEGAIRQDVRTFKVPPGPVWGILAAPPCTEFAVSGARWWEGKGTDPLHDAVSIVAACTRIIVASRPQWWALENPVGRLIDWLGPNCYTFDPYDFGDPYPKKTLLWGRFTEPVKTPVQPTDDRIHMMAPGPDRAKVRSMTPQGFARAFMEANP